MEESSYQDKDLMKEGTPNSEKAVLRLNITDKIDRIQKLINKGNKTTKTGTLVSAGKVFDN